MITVKLSKRLATCSRYLKGYDKVADIGTDHAYLPIYLIENKYSNYVIAADVAKGPLSSAIQTVNKYNYENEIKCILSDGLESINEPINALNIAGMGGVLISNILNNGKEKLQTVKRLVLQPNNGEDKLRIWLNNNNWTITEEVILEEDNVIYEIIVCEQGNQSLTEEELIFGPYLLKDKSDIFIRKWNEYARYLETLLSKIPKDNCRYNEIKTDIRFIKNTIKKRTI